ncbi:MAG: hypothetical protein P1U85_12340 [Verrucomicrobiales bacterium]|nr:hypothetical protein [Verrucomicrobiales bacterium]
MRFTILAGAILSFFLLRGKVVDDRTLVIVCVLTFFVGRVI